MIEHSDNIGDLLESCLQQVQAGDRPEACARRHPRHADELLTLLTVAEQARTLALPPLSPVARRRMRQELRGAVIAQRRAARRNRAGWFAPLLRLAAVALVVLLALGGGVAAAQASLPGDALYPLKRGWEQVQLHLPQTPAQRAGMHLRLAAARVREALALHDRGDALAPAGLADVAREYQQAWASIEDASGPQAPALRQQYRAAIQQDLAAIQQRSHDGQPPLDLAPLQALAEAAQRQAADSTPSGPDAPAPPAPATVPPPAEASPAPPWPAVPGVAPEARPPAPIPPAGTPAPPAWPDGAGPPANPPGQDGAPGGPKGSPPGQDGAPGKSGTAPGHGGSPPGQPPDAGQDHGEGGHPGNGGSPKKQTKPPKR